MCTVTLPFKDAFFRTFIAYNWPASGPNIFLTRNTWENRRYLRMIQKEKNNNDNTVIWLGEVCALTLPKEPWPRTLSSSNWDGSAFSQPSFTWWVIGISLYVPSSYSHTHSKSMRHTHNAAGKSTYMHTYPKTPNPSLLTQCVKESPSSMGSSIIWCPLTWSQNNKCHQSLQQ